MTVQSTTLTDQSFLRGILRLDAITCGVTALLLIAGANPLAGFLGVPEPAVLMELGVVIALYALGVWQISTGQPIDRRLALVPVILNAIWVAASVAILLSGWPALTTAGKWTVAVAADIVATLAILQYYGRRR